MIALKNIGCEHLLSTERPLNNPMNGIYSTKLNIAWLAINNTKVSHVRVVAFNLAKRSIFSKLRRPKLKYIKRDSSSLSSGFFYISAMLGPLVNLLFSSVRKALPQYNTLARE